MDPAIPPELLLPAPRTLRRRGGAHLGCLAKGVITVVGTVIGAMSVGLIVEPILIAHARLVDGQITDLHTTRGSKGSTNYHVGYRFTVNGGWSSDTEGVNGSIYRQLKLNQPVKVRVIGVEGWTPSYLDLAWQHYPAERAGAWAGIGFFDLMILLVLWANWRQKGLVRYGTPTMGTLVSKRMQRGKSTTYYMTYTFTPNFGTPVTRRSSVGRAFYEKTEPGDAVCVLYAPTRPKRALLYEGSSYVCVGSRDYAEKMR